MERKKENGESLVLFPEGAALSVEQNLYDAGDPDAGLIVTVHSTDAGCVGNTWVRESGETKRVLNERLLRGRNPDLNQLLGEVNRLVINRQDEISGDLRLSLGVRGLLGGIKHLRTTGKTSLVID